MANTTTYDDRLEHLLNVSARVFADHGYHSTAMRDLSRATGMSLAGMYHYVRSKEELLFLILQQCFAKVLAGAEAAIAEAPARPADEQIRCVIRHHVRFFSGHISEMKVLSHEAESLSDERLDAIKALKRSYVRLLERLIEQVEGRPDDVQPKVAAFALFGMMNWIYKWYDPDGTIPPDGLADQFCHLFFAGIQASLGNPITQGA